MLTAERRLSRLLIGGALAAGLALAPSATPARASGVVGTGTPASCTEAAFDQALAGGGTVTFNCGNDFTLLLTSEKLITHSTAISGRNRITLDGQNAHRLFNVSVSLALYDITLTQGHAEGDGGAIRNVGGPLVLDGVTIMKSTATASGGAIFSTGPVTLNNSSLEENTARGGGGGGLYLRFAGAQTTITNSFLGYNQATSTTEGWGGAILAWDGAPVTIKASTIYSNAAREGGGIYHFGNALLTLQDYVVLCCNLGRVNGGGLYTYSGTALLTDVLFNENRSSNPGGPVFDGNGGGLYNFRGTELLNRVTFTNNSADNLGGGLFNDGGAITVLVNSGLGGNAAENGGAVYNDANGTALVANVTLSGNTAGTQGGGFYNFGTANLTNVTLSTNSAYSRGGGLWNSGVVTLTQVTLSDNSAAEGGGIYRASGSVWVGNSIVANSPSAWNCAGGVTDGDFNLSDDASCGFNTVADMMLGPLANYGGPTGTHMLLAGSPAIDFVAAGCPPPATDQRGAPRPVDGDGNGSARCDAGAVEYPTAVLKLPLVLK